MIRTVSREKLNEIDSQGEQSVNSSTHIHKSKGGGSSQSVREYGELPTASHQ